MSTKVESSHALVVHKNKFLFLLRDNKPEITYPNCWSLLGGGGEEGETPEETLLRELKEEANLEPQNFQLLFKFSDREKYLYIVYLENEEVKKIKLGDEGQKLDFFTLDELDTIPLTLGLNKYLERFKPFLKGLLSGQNNPQFPGFP
ncbi:MAG: NUDIX domain-containing protein [bacterium]|nr:NUDIX domain-containing protein [bacterium]